ncbi:MAG TPA: hypothetical protein VGL84_09185 [Gaiellaceae bacterium]
MSDYENEEPAGFDEPALPMSDEPAFPLPDEPLFAPSPPELEEPPAEEAPAQEELANFDPFAGWPESESSALIEEKPAETESVEHVRG